MNNNHDVFISYSSKQSAAALAICHELEDKGIKCWMAPRDIPVGAKYASVITKAIVGCRIVVLVFSDEAARSPWVESEINIAFSNRKTIVPYKIDTANIEDFDEFYLMLNNRHWIEAYPDYKTRFKELVIVVAQTLGKTISATTPETSAKIDEPAKQAGSKPSTPKPTEATLHIDTDLDCRILRFGKEIGIVRCGVCSEIKLPKGKHKLQFIGLESDADRYECLLSVEDLEYEDYIEVKLLEKYNARKAHELAEQQCIETERIAKEATAHKADKEREEIEQLAQEKVQRDTYLLSLPDEDFVWFEKNGRYGYKLKSSGEVVIPLRYDYASDFSEGLALVEFEGKLRFIDKTGQHVWGTPVYDVIKSFSEGITLVESMGKYGFIDKTVGKVVIPVKYDKGWFNEGLAMVKLYDKWGVIDKTGNEITPLKYDDASPFSEGLAMVKLYGKWGFIDKTGNEITPLKYDDASPFSEGLAMVKLYGKWGFIDKTGKEITPLRYDWIYYFDEELPMVELNDKYGFIDKTGKEITPLKYDDASPFSEGLAKVESNGKWGFIDKTGKEVIPLKYHNANSFSEGLAKVKLYREIFYIDKNGNRIDK